MARIDIMASRHSAFYSPLLAAIGGGFLKREGLEPHYRAATPDFGVPDAIRGGAAHVAQFAVSGSWGPLERGESPGLVHFAQINERDGFFIVAREADPDFHWGKLTGRQILVDHGAQPLAMFKYATYKMGADYAALQAVDAGGVEAMDRAFRSGQGDFIHQQGPAPQQLEQDGVGHIVAAVGEAIGPVAFSSLCATPEWLETEMARAFMRAYRQARDFVIQTPAAEIAAAEAAFFEGIDRVVLARTIAFYQQLGCWNPEVRISRTAYEIALDVFQQSGLISARHPYESVVAAPPAER